MADDRDQPERPRAEPEIFPPERTGRAADWRNSPWRNSPWGADAFGRTRASHRVYVARVGPFGIALMILAIAAILAIIMIAALGAVLIWIPVVAVVIVAAALIRLLRGFGGR
jgi:hypothetical protein